MSKTTKPQTQENPTLLHQIRTGVRAGALSANHNGLVVRTGVQAGGFRLNHNGIVIRSSSV